MRVGLVLTESQSEQIRREASTAYPEECCGIMIGRDTPAERIVERLIPTTNVAPAGERRRRFAIDPLRLMQAERDASNAGLVVLGFYHSHPDHPARPSETDRQAAWAFYSYVIFSVSMDNSGKLASYCLEDGKDRFAEQRIEVRASNLAGIPPRR